MNVFTTTVAPHTVPVKGIAALHACKARVVHAPYTQMPKNASTPQST